MLGTISGVGGGMRRDLLVGETPIVLREGLYATPALLGSAIAVIAREGAHASAPLPAIVGATACFAVRVGAVTLAHGSKTAVLTFRLKLYLANGRGRRRLARR